MKIISQKLSLTLDDLTKFSLESKTTDLVLVHGNPFSLEEPMLLNTLRASFPCAYIIGCSSDGEMMNGQAYEDSVIYIAIDFEKTTVRPVRFNLLHFENGEYLSGKKLGAKLLNDDLVCVLLFCEGREIDLDEFLGGVREVLGSTITIWGGLASDKTGLDYTLVLDTDGVYDDAIVAVGLYGDNLEVNTATSAYSKTGMAIEITASEDNIIYEINNQPALDFFASVLNDQYKTDLASMLFTPIVILDHETLEPVFSRVAYYQQEESKQLYCAGAIPMGPAYLVNMTEGKNNLDDTIKTTEKLTNLPAAELALVASCVGRKNVLNVEWPKEISAIHKILRGIPNFGFYAYGEIGKTQNNTLSVFHNHALSILTLYET